MVWIAYCMHYIAQLGQGIDSQSWHKEPVRICHSVIVTSYTGWRYL